MDPAQFAERLRAFSAEQNSRGFSRPSSSDSRRSRKAPVPIVIPPKYDGDAPNKGLGRSFRNVDLNSAASTDIDSIFSPAKSDTTLTPLTSPCWLSPTVEAFGHKPSTQRYVESMVDPLMVRPLAIRALSPEAANVEAGDDQDESVSPTLTICPPTDTDAAESIQEIYCNVRSSAWSASSEERATLSALSSSSFSTFSEPANASHVPALPDLSAVSDTSAKSGLDDEWRTSLEAQILDRAGNDARSRRSRRNSPRNSPSLRRSHSFTDMNETRATNAPIPVPLEQLASDVSPTPVIHLAAEKIAIDTFDDEKEFLSTPIIAPALTDASGGLTVGYPLQSHFSWSSAAPPPGSSSPAQTINRPTLFAYAQSRHEYSRNRRLNFHLREPSASARKNMKHDQDPNLNPSVFAAELPGMSSARPSLHASRSSPDLRIPSAASGRGRANSSVRQMRSASSSRERASARSGKSSIFSNAFGQCFGRR